MTAIGPHSNPISIGRDIQDKQSLVSGFYDQFTARRLQNSVKQQRAFGIQSTSFSDCSGGISFTVRLAIDDDAGRNGPNRRFFAEIDIGDGAVLRVLNKKREFCTATLKETVFIGAFLHAVESIPLAVSCRLGIAEEDIAAYARDCTPWPADDPIPIAEPASDNRRQYPRGIALWSI